MNKGKCIQLNLGLWFPPMKGYDWEFLLNVLGKTKKVF